MWITNGTQADWICLLANTGDGPAHRNKSLIFVPMKSKGVQIARKLDKLGMRSSDTAQIYFDNVRVPQAQPHRRGRQRLHLPDDRVPGGAAVGRGLVPRRRWNSSSRRRSNTPATEKPSAGTILDNQVVHFKLAELQTEVELLRALIYAPPKRWSEARTSPSSLSMAKLKAGRLGRELTDACLQYWGGMGFMYETPVSRAYRDMRLRRSAAAPTR